MEKHDGPAGTISARDVVVRFGQTVALDHFSLDVSKGVVGLLGPNGAGKSTFIKAVLGLVEPEGGTVTVSGMDVKSSMLAVRDIVGYMPESDCLIDQMTGVELVTYLGRLSGMSKKDAVPRSHEVMDFVGLGEERYRPVGSYSTGMKQRVKLAQALVHDPSILFLDEPTNGLDPLGRVEMLDLIGRIAASDKTILVSSHILQDVERLCRDVVIVNAGKVVVQGDMKALLSRGDTRRRVSVRGKPENLKAFLSALANQQTIVSTSEEFGQVTVVIEAPASTGRVFDLASENGVQVRSFVPDRLSLEAFFLDAVNEVV